MKMKNFEIENFQNFRSKKFQNFSLEIVWKWKILRSKKIENFRSQKFSDANFKLLQLFSFSIKLFDFFYRSKWTFRADSFFDQKVLKNPLEGIKRKRYTTIQLQNTHLQNPQFWEYEVREATHILGGLVRSTMYIRITNVC